MAHVFTFWRFPDEERRFIDYLTKSGDILAAVDKRVSDPTSKELEPRPIGQLIEEEDPRNVLIGPREFMDMAQIDAFERFGEVKYGRYYAYVPLITYSRGVFRGENRLGDTNLAFVSKRTTADLNDLTEVPQPPEFVAWGKRVLGWARRDAPREVEYKRMTERVFAELANGLEVVY